MTDTKNVTDQWQTDANPDTCKKWVKEIGDKDLTIQFNDFPISKEFTHIGSIEQSLETRILWDINPIEEAKSIYDKKQNGIYIITLNNKIIKIGGTKVGMKGRISSYHCGHCIPERKKKNGENYPGKMSVTNAYCYNTILSLLYNKRGTIDLYFFPIPDIKVEKEVFGETTSFVVQCYDEYEKKALSIFQRQNKGKLPVLCNNSHP